MTNITLESVEKLLTKCLAPIAKQISALTSRIQAMEEKIDCLGKRNKESSHDSTSQPPTETSEKPPKTTRTATPTSSAAKGTSSTPVVPPTARGQRADARKTRVAQTLGNTRVSTTNAHPPHSKTPPTNSNPKRSPSPSIVDGQATSDNNSYKDTIPHDSNPWHTVGKHKPKRRQVRNVIRGTGSLDSDLQTVERVKKIHACFFKPETTAQALAAYMEKKNSSGNYQVEKLKLKHDHYASFTITVPDSKFNYFMCPDNWPPQTEVSEWFPRSGGRAGRAPSARASGTTTGSPSRPVVK